MAENASADEIAKIKELAGDSTNVKTTTTVLYDLMSLRLTKDDICTEIVAWIDAGGRVKPTKLHSIPGKVGNKAYEMKPKINDERVYIKVTIDTRPSGEEMLILSSHRDH